MANLSYQEALRQAKQKSVEDSLIAKNPNKDTLYIAARLESIIIGTDKDFEEAQKQIHHWREQALQAIHKLAILNESIAQYKYGVSAEKLHFYPGGAAAESNLGGRT